MILQTIAAHALAALAVQPGATANYVILADEARRARLERLLAQPPLSRLRLREAQEGGMYFVSCVSAWRHDPEQTEACLASRLPRRSEGGTIVLNTYHDAAPASGLTVTCHGLGGTGRTRLEPQPGRQDPTALERCLDRALTASAPPPRRRVGVRWADRFETEDPVQARSAARQVLLVAVDHVGIPRGSTGNCLVQGRVLRQERGSGIGPGAVVEAGIPCTAGPALDGERRRIWMGAMRQGRFARLYLGERYGLADFEPVDR